MEYENAEAIVRIQKNIRGFIARKRLVASSEKYAKINFRKINHKGISAVGFMDINTILVDFCKGIQWKQAPSPMDSIFSDLSGMNRVHNEKLNNSDLHAERYLNEKPLVSISPLEVHTKVHVLFQKPIFSIAEIIEEQKLPPLHQNTAERLDRIEKTYAKPENLIESPKPETKFPSLINQKESTLNLEAENLKNIDQQPIIVEEKTETISLQLLKKPICVIFIIRKLSNLKNIDVKPKLKAKSHRPHPPTYNSPKNLEPIKTGLKQSLSSAALYINSHQDHIKPSPYASQPLDQPLNPSIYPADIKKSTLPSLPVSSRMITTASRDIIIRSQKKFKPTSLAKDNKGQTYNASSPYDSKWIDQYLIDYFKVPKPQESLRRKQILKEKIQDLYKPKRF